MNLKTIKRYTYEAIIYFTMPHCLRGILHESCDFCANKFSIPPKSYPVNVPFKCDAGVDRYWHVTSVTCTGRANGGYKFQIKGVAQKTSRSLPIDLFYLMPGNRIKTAGTYYFPRIEEGKHSVSKWYRHSPGTLLLSSTVFLSPVKCCKEHYNRNWKSKRNRQRYSRKKIWYANHSEGR